MISEDRFAADNINVTLGLHNSSNGRWWGQAARTEDGISIKVEAYGATANEVCENLWIEWEKKVSRVPNFIPRLAPPIEDATFTEIKPDDIPF